ncbi:MAG: DUF3847 domain-containing protein [Oscillospiraceae bacterium]|jgi:hypothetical protein|nr:DUF3847 domain-containing protein [Oscillospiraceae bacterium]
MIKTEQKILTIDEQIAQLQNQRKIFVQKKKEEDRRERTRRLCTRGGAVEKLHPEIAEFTDEQFDIFVKKVILSDQTKRIIAEIAAVKPEPSAESQGGFALPESQVKTNSEPAEAENVSEQANP